MDIIPKKCKIIGCNKEYLCRKMCTLHYSRWKTYRDPHKFDKRGSPIPKEKISQIVKKYNDGAPPTVIAKDLGITTNTVLRHLRLRGIRVRTLSEVKLGELNPNWIGDKVSYGPLHKWVNRNVPKPELCELCKKVPPHDAANISQEYKREASDWEWLCRKCHMTKDGRLERLIEFASKGNNPCKNIYVVGDNKWVVVIYRDKKNKHIGTYYDLEKAKTALEECLSLGGKK